MALQILDGVKITPKGSYNTGRFKDTFLGASWPTSYAFGGWIYSATSEVGYSSEPTEIKVSIVLEAKNKSQTSAVFDIKPEDLKCDAGSGGDENLFDIDFNGVVFTDFILYSYDISIENNTKILNVVFKDYSLILDKIYVGLIKRQGNKFVNDALSTIAFPLNCADCLLQGDSFWATGATSRDISYGSYVGINGKVYDNFESVSKNEAIFRQWEKFFQATPTAPFFDLNGGYLMIGTEEASEEKCGNLPSISYNLNELLASLRYRGLVFGGAFPFAVMDGDFVYKQNYIGSLREVMQQWCSDLGLTFYCKGKNFIGVNLNVALDISAVSNITDPTTTLGKEFALNKNSAIISYKENNTLSNTFKQAVITSYGRPVESKVSTKTPKRYIGLVPMHPLDFNYPSEEVVNRTDVFGNEFADTALINSFLPNSDDSLFKRVEIMDNRTFNDVDTSIALTNYSEILRDIYCQDQALYADNPDDRAANFRALGMVPLLEVTEPLEKNVAINASIGELDDETTNISRDSQFYKVFIGYYYPKFKEDILSWEQQAASHMYKFGVVKQGLLQQSPYVPYEVLNDISPASGFSGLYGARVTRITHEFEPSAKQYFDLYDAPFSDILLYSGLRNFGDYFPLESWMAEISNDWGTTKEQFQRALSLKLEDACTEEFSQEQTYVDIANTVPKKFQDWKLNLFGPKTNSNLEQFFDDYIGYFQKISGAGFMERVSETYYNTQYKLQETCSKLHIIVIPDVRTHPNIRVNFNKLGRQFINPVVLQKYQEQQKENILRRVHTPTLNICEVPLLQDLCDNVLFNNYSGHPQDPRYSCVLEDPYNVFELGYNSTYLSNPNSRGLEINVIKNPIGGNEDGIRDIFQSSDTEGNFYYQDVIGGFTSQTEQQASVTIIYPVSVEPGENVYYQGILTSSVSIDNRSPEICEIYGEPVNTTNNNSVTMKVINNQVATNSDLQPQLDPFSSRFLTYMTVLTGNSQILTTVSGYHDFVKNLDNYNTTGITKFVELSLAGTPNSFGSFKNYLDPTFGLTRLSLSVSDNGVKTDLSFSDKPPVLPKQESILNSIGPRIK